MMRKNRLQIVREPLSNNLGSIWKIHFDEVDDRDVIDTLIAEGYEGTPEGLHNWIINTMFRNESEDEGQPVEEDDVSKASKLKEKIKDAANENPEAVAAIGQAAKNVIGNFLKNKIGL